MHLAQHPILNAKQINTNQDSARPSICIGGREKKGTLGFNLQ